MTLPDFLTLPAGYFWIVDLSYLVAAVAFIYALKMMASHRTARRGNLVGAVGMLIAVLFTLVRGELAMQWIVLGLVIGAGVGAAMALFVKMTAMPQMVALLNGFGGLASAVVVLAEFYRPDAPRRVPEALTAAGLVLEPNYQFLITVAITSLIGWVTFTGSVLAFLKLQEWLTGRPVTYPFQKLANLALLVLIVVLTILIALFPGQGWLLIPLCLLAAVLGVTFVLPIGGADMPVVISLLNSFSGLAAAAAGFVLQNTGLIIAGALVGASGVILTRLMSVAMNRSIFNVLFGAFGQVATGGGGGAVEQRPVKSYSPEDAASVLSGSRLVIVVPGYGMAVAQAQHAIKELSDMLEGRGVTVKFGIHPVAGRMPGHMNVLLAEADVRYDQLVEMDAINPEFEQCDAVLVIGANDVVNPAARHDKSSPIYGMPILNVDKARTVFVCKRSMRPGFAGIENELFYNENTMMLFGDAKQTVTNLVGAMKEYA